VVVVAAVSAVAVTAVVVAAVTVVVAAAVTVAVVVVVVVVAAVVAVSVNVVLISGTGTLVVDVRDVAVGGVLVVTVAIEALVTVEVVTVVVVRNIGVPAVEVGSVNVVGKAVVVRPRSGVDAPPPPKYPAPPSTTLSLPNRLNERPPLKNISLRRPTSARRPPAPPPIGELVKFAMVFSSARKPDPMMMCIPTENPSTLSTRRAVAPFFATTLDLSPTNMVLAMVVHGTMHSVGQASLRMLPTMGSTQSAAVKVVVRQRSSCR
jgi:hypothetical protein